MAIVRGPQEALRLLETVEADDRIADTHRLLAVRAHLHELAGDRHAAHANYRAAARRSTTRPSSATSTPRLCG